MLEVICPRKSHSTIDMEKAKNIANSVVAIYDTHTDEHVVGYYNAGDRMMHWGKVGVFWGGFWGLLFGSGLFLIPGLGQILIAGPLVAWIVAGLEGAAVVGGVSAVGAGRVNDIRAWRSMTLRMTKTNGACSNECAAT
jgi:uncharacterized membrane protein